MQPSHKPHLAEVKSYFDNGDIHIGYRRLMDASIETLDMQVYEHTLAFCDWYDNNVSATQPPGASLLHEVNSLLEKIGNAPAKAAPVNLQPKLKAENISKRYHKGSFKLSAVNIDLYPARIIGLVGENGNGKTTLLRMLYGDLLPDEGRIQYHLEHIPAHPGFYDIKTRLAFIPQRTAPWYGSLMDNLQFAATHYGFKGKDNVTWTELICARMGLRPFRDYTWNRISSGYKMRFELARTLIKRPEILLLDEPLANLDILAQQVILEDLRFMSQSATLPLAIILSSQQLYEVEKVSERVIFLKQGMPRYQDNSRKTQAEEIRRPLVLELETTASRDKIQQAMTGLPLTSVSYNGGVYLLYFPENFPLSEVIKVIGQSELPVRYFRDISDSSRRFFDA